MKKVLTVMMFFCVTLVTNSQTEEGFQTVDGHEAYCEDLAKRGAELEWDRGYIETFREYHDSYWEWYGMCMQDA